MKNPDEKAMIKTPKPISMLHIASKTVSFIGMIFRAFGECQRADGAFYASGQFRPVPVQHHWIVGPKKLLPRVRSNVATGLFARRHARSKDRNHRS
jgi:hypothetical protein